MDKHSVHNFNRKHIVTFLLSISHYALQIDWFF